MEKFTELPLGEWLSWNTMRNGHNNNNNSSDSSANMF